jgi:hypothetical protein
LDRLRRDEGIYARTILLSFLRTPKKRFHLCLAKTARYLRLVSLHKEAKIRNVISGRVLCGLERIFLLVITGFNSFVLREFTLFVRACVRVVVLPGLVVALKVAFPAIAF